MRNATLRFFLFLVGIFFIGHAWSQVTTGGINGFVKSPEGEGLVGAMVKAVHEPTGTVYKAQTLRKGAFSISNMNPGGPYTITVTYVGYALEKKSDVYVELGEANAYDFALRVKAEVLNEVTVTGAKPKNELYAKGGTSTFIGRDQIERMPTVGRTLGDYLRATPQLKMAGGGFSTNEGAYSIAGQNVRYNSFYVDGAVNNDVFGLAYSGTNGGQSGITPLSIDAIDQFHVLISPYDPSIGNFTGGAVNAITKSGTNQTHGSAYYIYRNQDMAGKDPTVAKDVATRFTNFQNKTFGATLGGAFIKNKLFYFSSFEIQRDENPFQFDLANYQGASSSKINLDSAGKVLQRISDTVKKRSGNTYDPGGYSNNLSKVRSNKLTTKIDWNINDNHKLTLSYRYTYGYKRVLSGSGPNSIIFENSGYEFPTTTNSASFELKSTLGSKITNRFLATFTNVTDDRGAPDGASPFPAVSIKDGSASTISFGTDNSSTFNYLKQKTYNVSDIAKYSLGKHTFSGGYELEYYNAFNSFIQNTVGSYQYGSVDSFLNNQRPSQYSVGFPLIGTLDKKNAASAAKFDVFRGAGFLGDELKVNQSLTFNFGFRLDYSKYLKNPISDPFATDTVVPVVSKYYDLKGAYPGQIAKIPIAVSPRLGFTYKLPSAGIVLRGGVGLFTGRIPQVWPGGIYNNNGISVGGYTISSTSNSTLWKADKVRFSTVPYTPTQVGFNTNDAKGQLNLIADKFKVPKVLRTSMAVDKFFGNGWSTTFEALFTKNVNDIQYQNVNLLPPTLIASGPDGRNVYGTVSSANGSIGFRNGTVKNPYTGIYVISNADKNKGFSYNLTFSVNKTTRTGFNFFASYNLGESYVLNDAQSSTNNSQWSTQESVNGRNFLLRSASDNSVGHRVFSFASKKFTYAGGKLATTIGFTYNGQSGQPYSYVYSGQAVRDGSSGFDLLYVPTADELAKMVFITTKSAPATPDEQRAGFEQYIQNDRYLKTRRGQYAERNAARLQFTNIVDARIAQDFVLKAGKNQYAFQIVYSMFNFTNFLNRDWGHQYYISGDNVSPVGITYGSVGGVLVPNYTFNLTTQKPGAINTTSTPAYASRWTSQLELRFRF